MKLKIDVCWVINLSNTDNIYPIDQIAENIRQSDELCYFITEGNQLVSYDVNVTEVTDD